MDPYRKRERLFTVAFLLIVAFTVARTVRHGWIEICGGICGVSLAPYQAPYAPEAYRIGIPALTRWIDILFHFKDATLAPALVDFTSCFLALGTFCCLALEKPGAPRDTVGTRRLTLAMFLVFIQFPIGFLYFHQRNETLSTTLFLALALLALSRAKTNNLWLALLFAATAAQAFCRADVPFIFGVATILLSLFPKPLADFGSRSANLLRGLGITLIAGGIQAYLTFVRFPNKHYGYEGVMVYHLNLNSTPLSLLALALLPFACIGVLLLKHRMRINSVEALVIASSLLYLPIWFTVGLVAEVRIFVPFLLALCIVAARVAASYLATTIPSAAPTSIPEPES